MLRPRPALLVIDNYDSFTFNLVQLLASLAVARGRAVEDVVVVRNDAFSARALLACEPGAVLISPGPGLPEDAGACLELARIAPETLPIFGVCLGMQILAQAAGARLARAERVMHGRTSLVEHDGRGCFAGLPERVRAMRYHSWLVEPASLPSRLEASAYAREDGALMALRDRLAPREAVQFHPESFLTEHGAAMLAGFVEAGIARTAAGPAPERRHRS